MTATDELRRLLDERGAEWDELVGHFVVVGTAWYDRDGYSCTALEHADDVPDGMLSVQANLTPAQAVEATLGRGTCKWEPADFITEGEWWNTSCGESFTWEPDGTPNYCPNCGKVVRA